MDETTKKNWTIGIIAVLALCAAVFFFHGRAAAPADDSRAAADGQSGKIPQPPFTPEVRAMLAESSGFQFLVSFTDRGFEPASATIKKGETVRFTNNSSTDLWVASVGTADGAPYPGGSEECGQSAFDTCKVLKPGEFWEFTFAQAGVWSYHNNRDTAVSGVVRVR